MKKNITIMLIEDHVGYREVIERSIKRESDIKITSQFGTAEVALRALQNEATPPDVILLDLNLPGMSGLEAVPWIKDYTPKAKIIVLSQSDNEADVLTAIEKGVHGYLLKSSTAQKINEAIRTVTNGGAPLDPNIASYILQSLNAVPKKEASGIALSKRESEILSLLSEGLVKKEIADKLDIGVSTVAFHIKNIYIKLQVQNAPAAISKAYKSGLFPS